jgi:hypothetical protein
MRTTPRDHFARVRKLGLRLPGVEESTSYGTAALKVSKKFLCRMKEDDETLVLKLSGLEEKEQLMQQQPQVFFETEHYEGWPVVLVRLGKIGDGQLARMLEEAWRRNAGKRLLAERAPNASPAAQVAAARPERSRAIPRRPRSVPRGG